MDNNSFQTSFIPKKPLAVDRAIESRPIGLFTFLSVIATVITILMFGGLFLYKNILINQKDDLSKSLAISRDSFESDTIAELDRFDKRSSAAKLILNNHIAISPFFKALDEITIPNIQYTKFDNQFDKDFSVKMSGLARDYSSIAYQAQIFNSDKGRYFKNVVFSNLTLSDSGPTKGYVSFDISFTIDPSLLDYQKVANLKEEIKDITTEEVLPNTDINTPTSSDNTNTTPKNLEVVKPNTN